MALKAKKPVAEERRLKALFYGAAGAGKTTAAIQFPRPYLIDTEKGAVNAQYVDLINKGEGAAMQTCDFDEVVAEVTTLLSENHPYKTLIIDPFTVLYDDLLDKSEREVGSDFGRHYAHSNKKVKRLMNLLIRLPMNVILTCHSKNQYGQSLSILGTTFDGYKKLDYLFDLVFEIQLRGTERVGLVKKSRVGAFQESETFPFSYDEIANRYGRNILERDAVPELLASADQVAELDRLIGLLNISEDVTDKWLTKANATTLAEMSVANIDKCIAHLRKQIEGKADE